MFNYWLEDVHRLEEVESRDEEKPVSSSIHGPDI